MPSRCKRSGLAGLNCDCMIPSRVIAACVTCSYATTSSDEQRAIREMQRTVKPSGNVTRISLPSYEDFSCPPNSFIRDAYRALRIMQCNFLLQDSFEEGNKPL